MLVRVHSECLTGDVFHSLRCDCGEQLEAALSMIEREGQGVLLYLAQEGRGIGLLNKLRAYRLQEDGLDTVEANERLGLPADLRDYGIGAQILADLGLSSIRILTNNPKKIRGLEGYGLSVSAQIPIEHAPNAHNEAYLRTKAQRMGHTLHHQGLNLDEELLHAEREHDRGRRRRGGRARPARERRSHRGARGLVSETFAIAVGRFYEDLAERLVEGAKAAFAQDGDHTVEVFDVPGAFELPLAANYAARSGRFAGVACLGAVIRGETDHYDFVCAEAARGVMRGAARQTGVPCAFGVLTVETWSRRSRARAAASATRARTRPRPCWRWPRCAASSPHHERCAGSLDCRGDGKGVSQLRQGAGVRQQPQPLDGRDQAPLRPEPAEGADPRRQGAQARLRMHALPQSGQGPEGHVARPNVRSRRVRGARRPV